MPYREIANILGFTEKQIRGRINNMGLTKNRKVNSDYFKTIDCSLKAYLLGFIYADGWVVCNSKTSNYEFGMQLQSQDRYILEKINEVLGGSNIIYHEDPCDKIINGVTTRSGHSDVLRVYSKQLVYNLISNGIETNKSSKDIFPIVKDELFFDFLRGYIDGDGCFSISKNHITCHITCNSVVPLKYIGDKLKTDYKINSTIYSENEHKNRIYISISNMKEFVNHLYYRDDLFCLKRKYEIVKSLINGLAA